MYVTKDPVTGRSVLVRRKTGSSSRKSKPSPGTDTGQPTPSGPPDPPYFIVPQPSVPAPAPQAGQSQAPHAQAMPVFPVPLHTQEPSGMHQPQFQYQAVPVYTTSSQSQVPQMMQFPPSTQPTFGAPVVVVQRPNEEPKPDAAKPEENKSAEKTSEEQQPEANKSDGPKPATQPETAAAKATPAPESPAPEQLAQNVTVQRTCTGCGKLRSASYHYRVVSGQGDPGKGFCRNCLADVTSSEGSTDDERHKRGRSKKGRSRARKSSDLSGKRASVESASSESSPDRHRVLPVETFTVAPPSTEWGSVESSPIQRRATRTSVVVNRSRPHEYHSENYHSRLRRDSFQSASSNHDHHRPSRQIVVVRRPSRADPVISYDYYDRRAPQEVVHPGPPSRWIPYRVGYMDNELEDHSVRGSRSWDVRTLGTASQEGSREAIERGYDSRSGQQLLYRDENYDAKIVSGGDAVRDRVPVRYIERQVRFVRTVDRSDRDDDEQAGITFADRERHHLYDVDGRGMRQGQTRRTQKHSHMNAPPPPQSETDSSSTGKQIGHPLPLNLGKITPSIFSQT